MSETSIVDALNKSELVRAEVIAGRQYVAVWYGGTGINVYDPEAGFNDTWVEVGYFSISDKHGRPLESESQVEKAMWEHFEGVESEVWDDE